MINITLHLVKNLFECIITNGFNEHILYSSDDSRGYKIGDMGCLKF
jgi:hypothetical protein